MLYQRDGYRAEIPDNLLTTQRDAVRIVLENFVKIATTAVKADNRAVAHRDTEDMAYDDEDDVARPHQVFTIDGARGSGKTYVLLSLAHAIRALSEHWRAQRTAREPWLDPDPVKGKRLQLPDRGAHFCHLAHVVRIIFPSDMENRERVMERIFASMATKIDQALERQRQSVADTDAQKALKRTPHAAAGGYHPRLAFRKRGWQRDHTAGCD